MASRNLSSQGIHILPTRTIRPQKGLGQRFQGNEHLYRGRRGAHEAQSNQI